MKTIIILSGKKSTGKDTSFDFIKRSFICKPCKGTGKRGGLNFDFQLSIPHCDKCEGKGFGYTKKIKKMSFADPLKSLCRAAFGLTSKQCYGESGERETTSDVKWSDLHPEYQDLRKEGADSEDFLLARDVLQIVGTNVMRNFYPNIWAKAATIAAMSCREEMVVFTDARFPNEIEEFQKLEEEGKIKLIVIRLHRPTDLVDTHKSELALDEWDKDQRFQYVVYNDGTLSGLSVMLQDILKREEVLSD
jgi:deoxynucleotide monophosphate kinase-like protein